MKIKLDAISLFLALTLAMTLLVRRYGFSLAELRELFSALASGGPVKEAITPSGICDLYGLRPDLLEKIINIYGKHNGMAC